MFITSHSRGHRIGIVGLQKTEGRDNNEWERLAGGAATATAATASATATATATAATTTTSAIRCHAG